MQRTRYARHLILGLAACGFLTVIVQGGCAESDDIDIEAVHQPDGGSNTGGSQATGGSQGTGASKGTGTGGNTQSGGSSGGGGSNGTGGFTATGGTTGTGGRDGRHRRHRRRQRHRRNRRHRRNARHGRCHRHRRHDGAGGTRATGGTMRHRGKRAAPRRTFTQVYQMDPHPNARAARATSLARQGGVSFSSQSTAYSAVKGRVSAGNAERLELLHAADLGAHAPRPGQALDDAAEPRRRLDQRRRHEQLVRAPGLYAQTRFRENY